MVYILNGEILQDNDPRVLQIKRNNGKSGPNVNANPRQGNSTRSNPSQPPHAPANNTANPLTQLATAVGLEGTVIIPAVQFLNWRSISIEKIYLAVFVVLVVMVGWRALAFGGVGYFIYQHQLNSQQGNNPP